MPYSETICIIPLFRYAWVDDEQDWKDASENTQVRCLDEYGHEVYEFDPDYIGV